MERNPYFTVIGDIGRGGKIHFNMHGMKSMSINGAITYVKNFIMALHTDGTQLIQGYGDHDSVVVIRFSKHKVTIVNLNQATRELSYYCYNHFKTELAAFDHRINVLYKE